MVPPAPLNTRNALEWYILDTPRRIDLFKKKKIWKTVIRVKSYNFLKAKQGGSLYKFHKINFTKLKNL